MPYIFFTVFFYSRYMVTFQYGSIGLNLLCGGMVGSVLLFYSIIYHARYKSMCGETTINRWMYPSSFIDLRIAFLLRV